MSLRRAVRDTVTSSHFADSLQLEQQQYNRHNPRWDEASYEGLVHRGSGVNGARKAQEVREAHFHQPRTEPTSSRAPEEYRIVSKECERKPTVHGDLLRIQEENCTSDDEVCLLPDSLSVNIFSFLMLAKVKTDMLVRYTGSRNHRHFQCRHSGRRWAQGRSFF